MPFVLLLVAAIFLVAAFNNTQAQLATALEQDMPGYMKWAAALGAVGALQWVPGMRTIAKYLLALVLLVIFLRNYQQILAGFKNVSGGVQPLASNPTPAAQYVASGYQAPPAASINPFSPNFNPLGYGYQAGQGFNSSAGSAVQQYLQQSSTGTVGIQTSPALATQYASTNSGALVPIETTGNVNAAGQPIYAMASALPFGQFDPALYSGSTASDSGFGGTA